MAGILIYTSASDSEGTLGSLSENANPDIFEFTLKQALKNIEICSHDPNCIDEISSLTEPFNHAACDSCLILPENCCVHFNKFLDRQTLVGDNFSKDSSTKIEGFFSELID